ncbi:MAG TPA: CRTAC1 family protein [Vicinamibacterales bacterium]|nr:CRTAC1 family protein [Vicinamibacterales bacterium]
MTRGRFSIAAAAAAIAVALAIVSPAVTAQKPAVVFEDATASAGIRFVHRNGAFGKKYLPETMGSGVVFIDADGDGWQDVFFVNGTSWPGRGPAASSALFKNNRNGTFTDVTRASGLGSALYGMGAAAGDYDNDGRVDLYVTALGANRLYRNSGAFKFADVTAAAGVGDPSFSTSAAWFDYDKDGRLDLFVANYVGWTLAKDLWCALDGKAKSYCTPESYPGQSPTLYRNAGGGRFENATKRAGLLDPTSKALGVTVFDYDGDSWLDLFVSNDTQPNRLYRNQKNGTFADAAVSAGVAFNEAGVARAGMGVDAADYDGSGRPSLVIGNFSNEMMALYSNQGNGLFIDDAARSTLGRSTRLSLTFACFFFDFDLDGWPDIFAANGHVADDIATVQSTIKYAQPAHLFRNLGNRRFEDVSKAGAALQRPVVARGAAYADYDNDGDLDVAVTASNGPARILRNQGGNARNSLRVRLEGVTSNRDGIGAVVHVTVGARRQWGMVRSGSSYLSQSELPLTFGLDRASTAGPIDVLWPSGRRDTIPAADANQTITIKEGRGIVQRLPFARR